MVREEIERGVQGIQQSYIQELRRVEVQLSHSNETARQNRQAAEVKRHLKQIHELNRQLMHLEHSRKRRSMEIGALRTALVEFRASVSETAPADKDKLEETQLLEEIRDERDSWRRERRHIEEQIKDLEAEMQKPIANAAHDPEKERLKRSVKQLQMSIDSRDRYACWVCNQRPQVSGDISDDDDEMDTCPQRSDASQSHEDEAETMKLEISRMRRELRHLRGSVSTPSSTQSLTPTTTRRSTRGSMIDAKMEEQAEEKGEGEQEEEEAGGTRKTLQFVNPSGDEAPSPARPGRRSSRDRIQTPFAAAEVLEDEAPAEHRVRFSGEEAEAEQVEPASSQPMRASRGRIPTPFVSQETAEEVEVSNAAAPSARVKFSEESVAVEETEAVSSGRMRTSRNRIPTPYVMTEALEEERESSSASNTQASGGSSSQERRPRFSGAVSEAAPAPAPATEAANMGTRSSRCRIATPFVSQDLMPDASPSAKTVTISETVSTAEPDNTDVSPKRGTRHFRDRISTPFILPDSVLEDDSGEKEAPSRSVGWSETVSAESPAAGAEVAGLGTRSSRGRISTPFVAADALQESLRVASVGATDGGGARGVSFSETVVAELPPAASSADACTGTRSSRSRIATPFVTSEAAGSVQFADHVDAEDTPDGTPVGRPVRGRVPTGFVRSEDLALEPPESSPTHSQSADGASAASSGQRGGVHFAAEATEAEAASIAKPGATRSVRGRTPTGFVHAETVSEAKEEEDDGRHKAISFRRRVSINEIEGRRASAAFDAAFAPELDEPGVNFSDNVSTGDAASELPAGGARSVRGRTPTGFVGRDQLPEDGSRLPGGDAEGVRFAERASEGEAASSPVAGARSVRGRTPTGFIAADALPDADGRLPDAALDSEGVRFADEVAVGDAASSPVAAGMARSVRGRTPTGFVSPNLLPDAAVGRQSDVRFTEDADVGDAASSPAAPGMARSIRGRTPTGFISSDALPDADGSRLPNGIAGDGLRFASDVSVEDAASSAPAPGIARSVRGRTPTGFVTPDALPADEPRLPVAGAGVRFSEEASVGDAASSPAAQGMARSVRGRTPTGFIDPDALPEDDVRLPLEPAGAGVRFVEDVAVEDAASSPAAPGARRSLRGRTPTGFISTDALPEDNCRLPGLPNGVGGGGGSNSGVHFSEAVDVEDAASSPAAAGVRRSVRSRTPTGFISADALPDESARLPAEAVANGETCVRFSDAIAVEDAASSPAAPGARRSVRQRTPTGFVSSDALPDDSVRLPDASATSNSSGVRFVEDIDVEDAASSPAASGARRSLRGRTPTGFISSDALPEEGLRLHEAPATSSSSGVRFTEQVDVDDAASSPAAPGARRSVRGRTPTGFVSADVLPEDGPRLPDAPAVSSSSSGIRFAEDVTVEDAASSPAAPGSRRTVRGRTPTGFISADALPDEGPRLPGAPSSSSSSGVRFTEEADVEDAASSPAAAGVKRSLRGRTPTGFITADALPDDSPRLPDAPASSSSAGVRFAEEAAMGEAASSPAAEGVRRSVRGRTPTGFISADALPKETCMRLPDAPASSSSAGVRFAEEAAVGEAASSPAAEGARRSVRSRTPTGFISADALPEENCRSPEAPSGPGVRFTEAVDVEDAASSPAAPGSRRTVRGRTPTGFISSDALPEDGCRLPDESVGGTGVRFAEEASVEDAASSPAAPGRARPVRGRTPTGFVTADALPEESPRLPDAAVAGGVRFAEGVTVEDAASSPAAPGTARLVRGRTPTGFIAADALEEDRRPPAVPNGAGVHFADDVTVGDAASSPAAAGTARSVRGRTPTGFIGLDALQEPNGDRPPAGGAGVHFAAEVAVGDAASSPVQGGGRSVRDRVPTGFMHADDLPEPEARLPALPGTRAGVRFDEDVSEGAAASSPPAEGTVRSVRGRTPTGFISADALPEADTRSLAAVEPPPGVAASSSAPATAEDEEAEDRKVTFRIRESVLEIAGRQDPAAALEEPDVSSRRVSFSGDESVAEAASAAAPAGEHRSIRDRKPTAYVHAEDVPREEGAVSFAANAECFEVGTVKFEGDEAITDGEGNLKSVRDRIPTAWVTSDMIPSVHFDDRCVRFTEGATDPGASCSARSVEGGGLSSRTTAAWTDTSSNKSLAESVSSTSSSGARALHVAAQGAEENEISDVETMSSCSSRNPRSRLSTPHVSPAVLSFPSPGQQPNETCRDSSRQTTIRRRPRSRSTSQPTSESDRFALKQVSIESNVEREITERVRRQERDDRLLRGKIAALGPVGPGRGSLVRTTSASGMTPSACAVAPSGFGMEEVEGGQAYVGRQVPGAVKDSDMLRKTLRKLAFFEEFDDAGMHSLIEAMEVIEFEDGEQAVRQGDPDGTHFFVVAEGEFVELRDGAPYCVIGPGCCFGESVLVLFGERTATVCARGRARAYAMEGMAVREMLRDQFEHKRTAVIEAVDEMLKSDSCIAFAQLNAYQLQRLYDEVVMRHFKKGETILAEGDEVFNELLVVISGTVSVKTHGSYIGDLERFSLLGDRGLLFREQTTTLVAHEKVEALVLKLGLLEGIFGDELPKVLLRDRIMSVLSQHKVFGRLHEEQREAVLQKCEIRSLGPNEELMDENVSFVACLHGEVETTLTGQGGGDHKPHKPLLSRSSTAQMSTFGDENLLDRDRPHTIHVRATGRTSAVKLAVWHGEDLDSILTFHDLDSALEVVDKVRVLKSLFLFQTLTKQQLTRLANALKIKLVNAGERVFEQGQIGTHLYIIRKGLVLVEIGGTKIRSMGMGDYFGERALLSSEPRTASVTASEDSELWLLDKPTFQEVMQGSCLDYLTARIALQDTRLEMRDLEFVRVIGRGGFGVVKMVKAARTGLRYALKCVRKRGVVEKGLQEALVSERSILAEVDHPFIVKFVRSFKNATRVYFLMEVVTGGELLDVLDALGLLKHDQARFYTGSIILALEFLHVRRIAYLDLKSENCLIDHQGFMKIIDFGIAQRIVGNRCHVVKGTPIFMAPEMVLGRGYTTVADLWSLGICLYEFLIGDFPFGNNNMNHGQIFHEVLRGQLCFPTWFERQPHAEESISLLRGLLTRDPAQRMGAAFDGYSTLKNHAFFRGFCWDRLLGREMDPPFIPHCETYAEDKEGEGGASSEVGLSVEEAEARDDPDGGWEDPEPGWDEDF